MLGLTQPREVGTFVLFPDVREIANGIPTSFLREGVHSNKTSFFNTAEAINRDHVYFKGDSEMHDLM